MLTLPSKFADELAKSPNTPSFLVKLEDGTLYNEQTLQADWAANTQASQIDYTTQAGSVVVESWVRPENLTMNTYNKLFAKVGDPNNYGEIWQSFKQVATVDVGLVQVKGFFKATSSAATVYCALFASNKTTQIGTTLSASIASNAGAIYTFDFTSQSIVLSSNIEYWIKFWSNGPGPADYFIYCGVTSKNPYPNGQMDYVWKGNLYTAVGESYFQVITDSGYYKPSGYIRTQTMDVGSTPTNNGEWVIEDIVPTGTTLTYQAWASATGAFAGEETDLGAIVDGDAITNLKRYYRVKATLTANGDQSVSPTLQSIKADFTIFKTYSDNPSLGHETAILSVSSLSSSIDTFKPSTIGQITFSLNLSPSVSNYLATKKPKNKLVQVKAGFVADGFLEEDYIDYSRGQIDDWKITAKDEVTLSVKDFSKEWDVDVPKATGTGLPEITWGTPGLDHPIDVMLDILKNHINARDSKILGSSFGTVKTALPNWIVSRTLKEDTVSAKDLMEELRLLTQTYFLPQADGKIKIKRWDAAESPIDTLTDADFISKRWDSDAKQIINRYVHFYGWDGEGDEAADYNTVSIGIDTTSQTNWRETTSKELKDKWTPQTQTAQVADFLDKIMKRYADPPSILQAEVDLRKIALEVGDIVTVTTSRAPSTDMAGIANIKFQIINRNLDYSKRIISLTMLECASSVNTQVEAPVAQQTQYDLPDHVDGLAIVEQEYINKDSSYTPLIVVTYELPANSTYWSHAIIQTSIDGGLTYKDYGLDYLNGDGFIIDASKVGGFVGGTFEVKVISVNTQGIEAPSATAPTASLDKIGEGTVLTAPPSAPRGLSIEGNPDPNNTQWDGLRFALTWWKSSQTGGAGGEESLGAGGFTDPYWNGDEYELIVNSVVVDSGTTKEARYDYVYGDGFLDFLDDKIAAANGTLTFKVRRVSLNQPSEWSSITITQAAPATPAGLASDFTGRNLIITWTKATETDFNYYELILNGITKKLTDPFYTYTLEENIKDNATADPSITYSLKTYDIYGNASSALTGTFTNSVPSSAPVITATQWMDSVQFEWTKSGETDISHYRYRSKIDAGAWSSWITTTRNSVFLFAEASQVIYVEVISVDVFGQELVTAATANGTAQGLNIQPSDINDFAITASKIFTKIPIISGDTWTDNSPSAGRIAWNAHTLYYNGVAYAITASDTDLKYIYWTGGTTYSASDTNPTLTDGQFIIATNVSGAHDLAWNAIANQVIGSAYIQNLAVQTAHIADLTVTGAKIADATIAAAKIVDATITGAKIANATITDANIASATITGAKIASATITDALIATATITGAKIASATITDAQIASLNADKITAGSIRGIGVYGSTHATKGSYLTATCAASDTTLYLKDTTDFPSSGNGWIIDSANDRDAIAWTGKTATTLTGCSGVLAHTVSASNVPVVVPATKAMVIADVVNEMRFFGDRGGGVIEELASIGISQMGSDYVIASFGNSNTGNSRSGVFGLSYSSYGVYGSSNSFIGVSGTSSTSYGVYGTADAGYGGKFNGAKAPIILVYSTSADAPTHSAEKGSLWVTFDGVLYINTSGSTTWGKVGAQ